MRPLSRIVFPFVFAASLAKTEPVTDLKSWTVEGGVAMDEARLGPGGKPSIKLPPKGRATLKLRDADGSGKVSFFVYDDGTVASPDQQKSVGPRWGTSEVSGRVLVGSIMYAKFLQPEGSICLVDTDPSQRGAWLVLKFVGPRGEPGWKKWEFDYQAETGLTISVDGTPVPQKYFDWNTSQSAGFHGLTLFGDDTAGASPQTVWIADITYELGPPMKVKPASPLPPAAPAPAEPKGPAPEALTEQSDEPKIQGKMTGFAPGPTLLDDLKNLVIPLVEGYDSQHPRLLFFASDREALQQRAAAHPELWKAVLANAQGVKSPDSVPSPELIRSGAKYWRVEKVQSAALAWFVTGEKAYLDGAVRWMVAHAKENIWGDAYRPNLDLAASWYLYHIAVGYDILKAEMSEEDRKLIRTSLAEHARAIYADLDPRDRKDKYRYDQNHTYIPTVGLAAAALALLEDVPDAKHWLTRSYAVLRRSRYVLNEDGYYYEGFGYWTYALNWHIRGAELLARATGENLFDLPALRDTWRFGLQLSLPGTPWAYGVGDSGRWPDGKIGEVKVNNYAMIWKIAAETGSRESRAVGDMYHARNPERDYPATAFLWFADQVEPAAIDELIPYHYFSDQDVVAWRSGWGPGATAYLFRSGPPLGHKATQKLTEFTDWTMNAGHVHPDIGGFWMFAKGKYLVVDTGYTAEKWTKDHNTLLVDDKGQAVDGAYHNERGVPYADLDQARITSHHLGKEYGFVRGDFGMAYNRLAPGVRLSRSMLMTERWLLIVDDMEADQARKLTWLCHSEAEFKPEGVAFVARQPEASLAVIPLTTSKVDANPHPTIVVAGIAPGRGTPEQRGFKLALELSEPAAATRFVNLLIPLGPEEKLPTVNTGNLDGDTISIQITWPDGKTESVELDLGWKSGGEGSPAGIELK